MDSTESLPESQAPLSVDVQRRPTALAESPDKGSTLCERVTSLDPVPGLTDAQILALQAIVTNKGLDEAAKAADVAPKTLYRWRKTNPVFGEVLRTWRDGIVAGVQDDVTALIQVAKANVRKAVL